MIRKINKIINYDDKKFEKALELLIKDIIDASIYNRLLIDLLDSLNENENILIESNTFWYLTIKALKEARMIRLCRIFEEEENSLTIFNLLHAVKENTVLFTKELFKERLKENPSIDSLSEIDRDIDLDELENELLNFKNDPIIKKIIIWRNNYLAHKSIKTGLNNFELLKKSEISTDDINDILERSKNIINKYLNKYKAVTWSSTILGHDDYKGLIKFFNIGMEKYERDIKEEIERFKKNL